MTGLEAVRRAFKENFVSRGEVGASLSVWKNGEEVLRLAGGFCDRELTHPWDEKTAVLTWSANKGVCAACVLHLLQERGLHPSILVAEIWPKFASHGKSRTTVAQLLSHQAGVPALREPAPLATEHERVAEELADMSPWWEPGTKHGYHARTAPYLWDELVRRLSGGKTLAEYWRETFAEPFQIEFWFGVPEHAKHRVAEIYASRVPQPPEEEAELYRQIRTPGTLQRLAFSLPAGPGSISGMNRPEVREMKLPFLSGIGTASALGKFYALLANGGELEGKRMFKEETLRWMMEPLVNGPDETLLLETSFSHGFFKDPVREDGSKLRKLLGPSTKAFGHPEAAMPLRIRKIILVSHTS
jgi:CubicO group peptidase (beta-lactamase class C family)